MMTSGRSFDANRRSAMTAAGTPASSRTSGSALLRLEVGSVHSLSPRSSAVVRVREGRVWATRAGDGTDYLLRPGERLEVRSGEHVVLQALSAAVVEWAVTGAR